MTKTHKHPTQWIGQHINGLDVLIGFHAPSRTLTHLAIDDPAAPFTVGTILKARVVGYNTGMKAFDIEWQNHRLILKAPHTQYTGGDTVTVQVQSLPDEDNKAPVTSTDIRLTGYHVIVLPNGKGVHFSSKIPADKRDSLTDALPQNCPFGVIIRSNACADKTKEEINNISKLPDEFKQSSKDKLPCFAGAVRDTLLSNYQSTTPIFTDKTFMDGAFLQWATTTLPDATINMEEEPFERDDIFALIDPLTDDTMMVMPDCTITVEVGKTLTAIDVNYAGNQPASVINTAVADFLAHTIPLRGLSGMIVIDFLRMNDKDNNQTLEKRFKQALPASTDIKHFGFTRMGLYEITARKRYGDIKTQLLQICGK